MKRNYHAMILTPNMLCSQHPTFLWNSKQPVSNIIYSLCGAYFLVKFLMLVCIQMFDFLFSWGVLGICISNGASSKIESCQTHWKDVIDRIKNHLFFLLYCFIHFLKNPLTISLNIENEDGNITHHKSDV